MTRITSAAAAAALMLIAAPQTSAAQASAQDHQEMEMMGDSMPAGKHLRLTPHWPAQPGDQARADSVVNLARSALAQYADVAAAEQAGYRMFAPTVKGQKVYHYSNRMNALKARWTFDPTAPSALLYQPETDGSLRLIGAMYTAPAAMSLDDLNRRIPLSIAQWHEHTSICLPPGTSLASARGGAGMGGRHPQFGPRGSITTEAACTAAGGTFKQRMFAWMVHVNLFESPDQLWEHKH
jgi:hypothetical protein